MNLRVTRKALITAGALLGFSVYPAFAQTAPAPSAPSAPENTVKLDPFTVNADSDVGFVASSSLAGGRINTALKDTPVAFSVITKEFLDAFNITDMATAGNWSTNTTYTAGDNTNFGYGGNETTQLRIRGINVNAPTRNFFPYASVSDSFDIDRIDFARGANSVLFGAGGAGGTQNTATKQAITNRTFGEVRTSIGTWNKYRLSADYNYVVNDKFAIRANVLWSSQDNWQDRTWQDKQGLHITGTYKITPKLTFRAEAEYLKNNRTVTVYQFRDLVSAWDGKTYENGQPLTGPDAPTAAQMALWGVARAPQRFVSHPSYGGQYLGYSQTLRTTGLAQNNAATNLFQGKPIVTVGWSVRNQSMIDGNDGLPQSARYAGALAGSPFFKIPGRGDTGLWDDPRHQFPVNGQTTTDLAAYLSYAPFEGMFIELAADRNANRGKGDTAQRRGMQEFYIDIQRNRADGTPNPWFLHTYEEQGHYKQMRNGYRDTLRLQTAYVKDTRIGKLQLGVLGSLNVDKVKNRSSLLLLPANWIAPDGRAWLAASGSDLNEFFVWNRYYTDDTSRIKNPAWSSGATGRPGMVVDNLNGVRQIVTPTWMWDARREDNVFDSSRDSKYIQAAGNFDLFKNRLVFIGAFRRDFINFTQTRILNPGSFPAGWDGTSLILRPSAPKDYDTLQYYPKDANGKVNGVLTPADTRPRVIVQQAQLPVPQYANDRFRDDYNSPDVKRVINTGTAGFVINLVKGLGVYANKSTAFTFGNANQNVFNAFIPPTISRGEDYGLRLTLPNNKLAFSAGHYHTYQQGALVTIDTNFLGDYNAIGDLGPVGDLTGRNIRDFARFRTNNIASTQTNDTHGYEFEATANLLPNWRLTVNYGTNNARAKDQNQDLLVFFDKSEPIVRQILKDGGLIIGANGQASIDPAVNDPTKIDQTRANAAVSAFNDLENSVKPTIKARPDKLNAVLQNVPWTANVATDYRIRKGPLAGLRMGLGVNLRGDQFVGNKASDTIRDPNNPANAIDDPKVGAFDWVMAKGYWMSTGTLSYTLRLKDSRRFAPKNIQFDLTVDNLTGKSAPIYGFTSTGGQNTNGTNFQPNDGPAAITTDPSRHSVPGNFFYPTPRNWTLSAKMDF